MASLSPSSSPPYKLFLSFSFLRLILHLHVNYSLSLLSHPLGTKKKGTRTIQFTLDSPGEQEPWVVRQKPAKPSNHRKRRASRKKTEEEDKVEAFATDTLERLKALAPPLGLRVLERRFFDHGRAYLTLLPDRTGYCK